MNGTSKIRRERIQEIERQLADLDQHRKTLIAELSSLQSSNHSRELPPFLGLPVATKSPETPEEKIELFLRLFRGRESVYPKRWESKTGKSGYSPACTNEWVAGLCGKPPKGNVKCTDCPHQAFPALDAQAVREHLQGKNTIGTYAIREDDTCTFLATDFDGDGWEQDASAFRAAARDLGVKVEIERSRSGNGAHAWIFFREPIQARVARQLGTVIVARAQAARHTMSLSTYDRFFPSQDTLPKGGFGNLIALPLQKVARENANSIFLEEDFSAAQDQWELLSSIKRLGNDEVRDLLQQEFSQSSIQFIQYEDQSVAASEQALDSGSHKIVNGSYLGQITIEVGPRLSIDTQELPSSILSALKRSATFANPEFFRKERMRFSTWQTPRFIFCGEIFPDRLVLPRGCLDACLDIAKKAGSSAVVRDMRPPFGKIKASFTGELSTEQKRAVGELSKHDIGVLVAPPGAGKTVMGCALIAKRKVPTLVLVHLTPLMEQWRQRISEFLGTDIKKIGTYTGTRKKLCGQIDVAMLPSLAKLSEDEVTELLAPYGQIIIDECHHLPAVSFDNVLKKSPARYVVGLTATPYRKDGHQAIIHMQCGQTRYEIKQADGPLLIKKAIVRETAFELPEELGPQPAIHLVWERLVCDHARLALVARDLKNALERGRFPLVISERKEHLELLRQAFDQELYDSKTKGFLLVGGMGKKIRASTLEEIKSTVGTETRPYILATGSFIGEGFDFPALDTLMIAMPISFKGRMIQYAGRLHRASPGKTDVVIYDYLDSNSALANGMFRKRLAAYRKMEYQIETEAGSRANRMSRNQ